MEDNKQKTGKKQKPQLNAYVKYSGLGFQMIAVFVIAAFSGRKLDAYWEFGAPVMTITLLLAAVVLSMVILVKNISQE